MPFAWQGILFEGLFRNPGVLEARAGIYTVWCSRGDGVAILDVGEAGDVRARVLAHDRKDCWRRNCAGEVMYAAYYTPGLDEPGRRRIESQIRAVAQPPCGAL